MDKRVIFAVAGSGKSKTIIDRVHEDSRILIFTYTELNTSQLKQRIIKKLGYIPEGVRVYTYFSFLYSFCYRPLCGYELKTRGIVFPKEPVSRGIKRYTREYYIDSNDLVYAHRIAKLLIDFEVMPEVISRVERYFDLICIDEVQDFAANDFNFLCELSKATIEIMLVGDFYQHTFDTSKDGNTRRNLHDDFEGYCKEFRKAGYQIDTFLLSKSYRCSPTICRFISNELHINIESHRSDEVNIKFLENADEIKNVFLDESIVKLFYQNSNKYKGNTQNWGKVKGVDCYDDVCVVLNKNTYEAYQNNELYNLKPPTLNKLYVACTRAKRNLYFIEEQKLRDYKI
ncbi:UvrD-helicase domain-containing protein [Neisseria zalophi]|uniref:DNA 3'-5' helicase II n=1 Tax=Neisseria zalophi TaxID=640030 RepID=A0A5J6PRK0_9NEIS|nr:UvrD-helicase domain-containing protein [Neisseria zalophi]QEY25378.1 DNA helicase UvrD [Neisseria zalophi]